MYRAGNIEAVCGDSEQRCDSLALTLTDIEIYEVDLAKLCQEIGAALGFEPAPRPELRRRARTWSVGALVSKWRGPLPVYLVLPPSPEAFRKAVLEVSFDAGGPFVLLTPLSHRGDVNTLEVIQKRDGHYAVLEELLEYGEPGKLTAVVSLAEVIEPTAETARPAGSLFRRSAGTWEVVFEGEREVFEDSKGMRLLAVLLQHPGREFSPVELENEAEVVPLETLSRRRAEIEGLTASFPGGFNPNVEGDSIRAYKKLLRKTKAERAVAEDDHLEDRAESLRECEERLEDLLSSIYKGTERDLARNRVAVNLKSCIEKIDGVKGKGHKRLSKHLSRTLRRLRGVWVYRPTDPPRWIF